MERLPEFFTFLGQGDSVGRRDWGLQRKGPIDQARHNEKVKETIRKNLPDIISREDIITSDGKRSVRVPIRSLDLPDFQYGIGQQGVGSGQGEVGDIVAPGQQPGTGKQGGDGGGEPGIDYYEAEISVDELIAMAFEDLGLPNLEDRGEKITEDRVVWDDVARKGPMSNLDKRRTFLESLKRNALESGQAVFDLSEDDLRFKVWNMVADIDRSAVIIAMRDVSGSMGDFERYVTRVSCKWMVEFLRRRYKSVAMVFIAHHHSAQEVDEPTFFQYGETGGTIMSSAYQLAIDIMKERYPWEQWNIYPFHFTDGYNFSDDDQRCKKLVRAMLDEYHANMFGFAEIQDSEQAALAQAWAAKAGIPLSQYEHETLKKTLDAIGDPRVVTEIIAGPQDINKALRSFFRAEGIEGAVSRA